MDRLIEFSNCGQIRAIPGHASSALRVLHRFSGSLTRPTQPRQAYRGFNKTHCANASHQTKRILFVPQLGRNFLTILLGTCISLATIALNRFGMFAYSGNHLTHKPEVCFVPVCNFSRLFLQYTYYCGNFALFQFRRTTQPISPRTFVAATF
jgi:hypothetical protein